MNFFRYTSPVVRTSLSWSLLAHRLLTGVLVINALKWQLHPNKVREQDSIFPITMNKWNLLLYYYFHSCNFNFNCVSQIQMQDIPLKNVSGVVYNAQRTWMTDFLRLYLQSLGGQPKVVAFLPHICQTQSSANRIFTSRRWFRTSTSEYTAINL